MLIIITYCHCLLHGTHQTFHHLVQTPQKALLKRRPHDSATVDVIDSHHLGAVGCLLVASLNILPIATTLIDPTHWLCKGGLLDAPADNQLEANGPCVATPYHRLELIGLHTHELPGFAGVTLELVVLKKDAYGQTNIPDSLSSVQLFSAMNDTKINFFLGSIFASFKLGRAVCSITIKLTFANISVSMGFTSPVKQITSQNL